MQTQLYRIAGNETQQKGEDSTILCSTWQVCSKTKVQKS